MSVPNAFLSSTDVEHRGLWDSVSGFLKALGFHDTRFERSGAFYGSARAPDESCHREVRLCQPMVLLMGGQYGSRASNMDETGKMYASVTNKELETAFELGIPVLMFVGKNILDDHEMRRAFSRPGRDEPTFDRVDDFCAGA